MLIVEPKNSIPCELELLSRLNQRQHWIGENAKKQKKQKQRAHTPTPAVNAETTLAEHTPFIIGIDQQSFRVEYRLP